MSSAQEWKTEMEHFLEVYRKLDRNSIEMIDTIYTKDITFKDPAHEIIGLEKLRIYFTSLYQNVTHIDFEFKDPLRTTNDAYVQWQMRFAHPRLCKGETINVNGATFLRFSPDNKVHFHQDFFDLGAMLYEHIPILGQAIKSIKRRLGS